MHEPRSVRVRARLLRATTLALLALPPLASRGAAQGGLGQVDDATTVPRGLFRLRTISAWTRYDEGFTPTASELLGAFLIADSLGV